MLPLLAFVGRPNVGKSTLFNRVIGRRLAIVEDVPGVTRDRQYAEADHDGRRFRVVDTGGFTPDSEAQLVRAVREQAEAAIREADAIVLVVDAEEGLSSPDRDLARILRKAREARTLDLPSHHVAHPRLGNFHLLPRSARIFRAPPLRAALPEWIMVEAACTTSIRLTDDPGLAGVQ